MNSTTPIATNSLPSLVPAFWRNGLRLQVGLLGLGVIAGIVIALDDLETTSDSYHGLGIIIGVMIAICCAVPAILALVALKLERRNPKFAALLPAALPALVAMVLASDTPYDGPQIAIVAALTAWVGLCIARLVQVPSGLDPVSPAPTYQTR